MRVGWRASMHRRLRLKLPQSRSACNCTPSRVVVAVTVPRSRAMHNDGYKLPPRSSCAPVPPLQQPAIRATSSTATATSADDSPDEGTSRRWDPRGRGKPRVRQGDSKSGTITWQKIRRQATRLQAKVRAIVCACSACVNIQES